MAKDRKSKARSAYGTGGKPRPYSTNAGERWRVALPGGKRTKGGFLTRSAALEWLRTHGHAPHVGGTLGEWLDRWLVRQTADSAASTTIAVYSASMCGLMMGSNNSAIDTPRNSATILALNASSGAIFTVPVP